MGKRRKRKEPEDNGNGGFSCLFEECCWSYNEDIDSWVMPIPGEAPCLPANLIRCARDSADDKITLIDALERIKVGYADNNEMVEPIIERLKTGQNA